MCLTLQPSRRQNLPTAFSEERKENKEEEEEKMMVEVEQE